MFLRLTLILVAVITTGLVVSCIAVPPPSNSPHFNLEKGQFEHPNGVSHAKSPGQLFGFARQMWSRAEDPTERTGIDYQALNAEDFVGFDNKAVWLGHSTVLLSVEGLTLLTDPIFERRASPVGFLGPARVTPAPAKVEDLPPIDIVMISHAHYDHLDKAAIKQLAARRPAPQFLVPLGMDYVLHQWGIAPEFVTALDWWQSVERGGATITATPVQHWSNRSPFDRNKTLWAGWMVQWPQWKFYFAGDTGYSQDFVDTRERLGAPDFAAIPIGAYLPRDFMKNSHVNPEEAVQIFDDLRVPQALGVHWGTYKLTTELMMDPPQRLADLMAEREDGRRFWVRKPGEIFSLR